MFNQNMGALAPLVNNYKELHKQFFNTIFQRTIVLSWSRIVTYRNVS